MVRFKAWLLIRPRISPCSFNSYMVRFKVLQGFFRIAVFDLVSIPIWFDLKTLQKSYSQYFRLSFNSYMVRFKVITFTLVSVNVLSFNSYMVRFKACSLSRHNLYFRWVSIPIWFDLKLFIIHFFFNSTCFNSYMVRFKELWKAVPNGTSPCFNSYMVRFKATCYFGKPRGDLFQFLYGSI